MGECEYLHTHTHTCAPFCFTFFALLLCTISEVTDPGCGSRIWSGGPVSEAESCQCRGLELHQWHKLSVAGVQCLLKGPGSFWVFNAQICLTSVTCAKLKEKMEFPA